MDCGLAFVLLAASAWLHISPHIGRTKKDFLSTLDASQMSAYKQAKSERAQIAMVGALVGLGLALVVHLYQRMSWNGSSVCRMIATAMILSHLWYLIMPKSHWMLRRLKNNNQIQAWLHNYRAYQVGYHKALAVGVLALLFA